MSTTTKIQIDTKTFIRFWLVIIGFGLLGLLLFKARFGIGIILAALFLALAISPLIRHLANILPSKNRTFATALSYILVVGFVSVFLSIVIPTVISESTRFFNGLPSLYDSATGDIGLINKLGRNFGVDNLQNQLSQYVEKVSGDLSNDFGNILATSVSSIASIIAIITLSLVLAFFMLTEGPNLIQRFWRALSRSHNTTRAQHVVNRLTSTVSQYVSGAIVVAFINSCATIIAVFIICLCFGISPGLAFPFGLITGVFSLIPMFGSFIGGLIVSLLLGFNALWAGIAFLIYTIIYLQIESNIISPKVQGKGMKLPALVILSAVTIGVYAFGLIGAIISIPIAGCLKVLIDEYGEDLVDDGKINNSHLKNKTKKGQPRIIAKN